MMRKPEYSFRSATGADVPKVAALVDAAYGHYVECLGMLPRPMTDVTQRSICLGGVASVETRGAVKNACELQDRAKEVPVGNVVTLELVSVDGVMESPEEWAFSYSNEKMEEANAARLSAYGPHETSGTPMVDYVNSGTRRVHGRQLPRKERP